MVGVLPLFSAWAWLRGTRGPSVSSCGALPRAAFLWLAHLLCAPPLFGYGMPGTLPGRPGRLVAFCRLPIALCSAHGVPALAAGRNCRDSELVPTRLLCPLDATFVFGDPGSVSR